MLTICPDCQGSGLAALCRVVESAHDTPCVLRSGHTGPHYGEDDVASDWSPAAPCAGCSVCPDCGSSFTGLADPRCETCGRPGGPPGMVLR